MQLAAFSIGCFLIWTSVLFSTGDLLAGLMKHTVHYSLRLLVGISLGMICIGGLVGALSALGFAPTVTAWVLRGLILSVVCYWIVSGSVQRILHPDLFPGFLILFAYYLVANFAVAFPNGLLSDIRGITPQLLTGLPIDNLIPYNVSRYFVEGISPQKLDVVPFWNFADRGPLAGLFAAAMFLLLGIEETGHWLVPSAGVYAVYQSLLEYLNLLSLFAVWVILKGLFDRITALFSVLVLGSGFFYFANILFPWPKFLMAFFVLVACVGWTMRVPPILCGVLFGGALLAHDSALFSLLAFAMGVFFLVIRSSISFLGAEVRPERSAGGIRPVFQCLVGFFACYAPWMIYKAVSGAPANRVLLLNLFCYRDQDISEAAFLEVFQKYLQEHSIAELLSVRLQNLWFPFNIFHPWRALELYWHSPYQLVFAVSDTVFFQLIYSVGPIFFALCILAFALLRRATEMKLLALFFWTGLGSIVPAALLLGCPLTTFSHHWAYPAVLVIAMGAGMFFRTMSWWKVPLLLFALAWNFLVLYVMFVLAPTSFLSQHASFDYFVNVGTAVLFLFAVFVFEAWKATQGSDEMRALENL